MIFSNFSIVNLMGLHISFYFGVLVISIIIFSYGFFVLFTGTLFIFLFPDVSNTVIVTIFTNENRTYCVSDINLDSICILTYLISTIILSCKYYLFIPFKNQETEA